MGSGQKIVKINPRERALSTDVNRLQAFGDSAMMQALFYMLAANLTPDFLGLGTITYPVAPVTSAPAASVLGGLLPLPQATTFDFTVTAGLVAIFAPDAISNPDDSSFKFVEDPGVQVLGTLTVPANPGPGTRIDILECQPIDTVLETDNRDIFDPSTGLFAPVMVDKVVAKRLTYRIRSGAAGGGFPGLVAGWLPLCVVSVPQAAGSLDDCEVWDCRPLVQGHERGNANYFTLNHNLSKQILGMDTISAAPARNLRGYAEADSNYPVGGHLRIGGYNATSNYVNALNLEDAANLWEPGFAPVLNGLWHLYIVPRPFGLPRFAKYNQAPGARLPCNPEGILVVSNKIPNAFSGAGAGIILPAVYGLGAAGQGGICLASGAAYDPGGGLVLGMPITDGLTQYLEGTVSAGSKVPLTAFAAATNAVASFTLTPGMNYPNHAKSVLVQVAFSLAGLANALVPFTEQFTVRDSTNAEVKFDLIRSSSIKRLNALGNGVVNMEIEVPVFPGETQVISFAYNVDVADATVGGASANIRGWRF